MNTTIEQRISPQKPARSRSGARVPFIRFENVSKRFGGTLAIDAVSLDIFAGEFFALLGPSGCGKTTLLRLLAGFETPDSGRIILEQQDLVGVPVHRRPVNMMFQSYALFPHMTVRDNIAFGLKQERLPKSEIASRVVEMMKLVALEGLEQRMPNQLSGGQRQRVALARALAKRPRVLLLDEPLAALDKKLREDTQLELKALQQQLGTTFIIVTHDQTEAMTLADRLAVMDRGHIAQTGAPNEIYEQPNSRYVANFIGDVNLIEGTIDVDAQRTVELVTAAAGRLQIEAPIDGRSNQHVWLALRPEKISLAREQPRLAINVLPGMIEDINYLGQLCVYRVRLPSGFVVKVVRPNVERVVLAVADPVWLSFERDAGVLLRQ